MLGGFSMTWKGVMISDVAKTKESQFLYLMQMILHNRKEGVSREKMEEILFEGKDIADPHHTIQTIIYNAKKKLKQAGLPEINYIERRKKNFYWTDEIQVVEDASEFEKTYLKAEAETDPDRKRVLYLEACYLYTGEFLPNQTAVLWVAQEARRYRMQFYDCLEKVVPLLREKRDYPEMETLGLHASHISPLANWECVTMEAIVAMGRYEDARKFYEATVNFYLEEQGLKPSRQLLDIFKKLGNNVDHQYDGLDKIQAELTGNTSDVAVGGYICSYPVFQGVYRMVERMMERGGQSVYLMLCTIVDSKGNPMKDGAPLDELSQRLGEAIRQSVRHGDAINRYSKGQYLILLVNLTRENCLIIQKRINKKFILGHQRVSVQYSIAGVESLPDKMKAYGMEDRRKQG
jgi:DNA-binding SARP family transcriptional activator